MVDNSIVALDIGGTNIRIGLVSLIDHSILHKEKISSDILTKSRSPYTVLTELIQNFIGSSQIKGLVIGFPSLVSLDRKTILQTPNIKGFQNYPIKKKLEESLSIPVLIEKDVNLIHYYHTKSLPEKDKVVVIGFYIGTGLGFAISQGNSIFLGSHGVAGELGHIPLQEVKKKCNCGNPNCIESLISGKNIINIHSRLCPKVEISSLFKRYYPGSKYLVDFIDKLALLIAGQINVLDPSTCIISGGVTFMPNFPKTILKKKIMVHVRKPLPHDHIKIYFPPANDYAGVIGGSLYFKDNF